MPEVGELEGFWKDRAGKYRIIYMIDEAKKEVVFYDVDLRKREVRHSEDMPLAGSLIAATSILRKAVCITDSPHFEKVPQVKCRWI